MKPSFIIKGALTFVMPPGFYGRKSGGSYDARYCYSVFMRHLVRLNEELAFRVPSSVAEIGPGDSIGMGLCALLSGAEEYIGLDVVRFTDISGNIGIFDELVHMFRDREPIPDEAEFPRVLPKLTSYDFPHHILDDELLEDTLADARIGNIRKMLTMGGGEVIRYAAPWSDPAIVEKSRVSWIFSQAVLEHIDDLETSYAAFAGWLTPGGIMSHQVDFKCHNSAHAWNGHWAAPEWIWKIVRGKRPYFLNRQPVTRHRELLQANGLQRLHEDTVIRHDGIARSGLPSHFTDLPDEDICTAGSFMISRKPDNRAARPAAQNTGPGQDGSLS